MNICVIGGSCFIGTNLRENHEITIIDKQPSEAFPGLVSQGDIRDREFLFEDLKCYNQVIRCAN